MSPTVLREKGFRFYFFSLEENRMHVPVTSSEGDAKFWLEPEVGLAMAQGLGRQRISEARKIIEEHRHELTDAWRRHLSS